MRAKYKWLAVLLALVMAAGVTACNGTGGGSSADYTLEGVSGEIQGDFGTSYTAPQYKILKDGVDTGYRARLSSATDPDGAAVTVSYSSFTLGKQGKYTLTYVSVGLKDAEGLSEEKTFTVILNSSDTVGPTVNLVTESQFLIWVGKELALPVIDARDTSGVKDGSTQLYVETPDGVRSEPLTGSTYTPAAAGTYNWVATSEDNLGNKTEKKQSFTVVAGPNDVGDDVIGYFNDPFGADQITAYNAQVAFDEAFEWQDGTQGATKFTSELAQTDLTGVDGAGRGLDYVMCFELMAPYIQAVTGTYDYIVLPMYNPNDQPITVRAWFWANVTIQPGEYVYYAVPSEHFKGGNQHMTNGNYETIYDVEKMVFAVLDRYGSWYTDAEFDAVGADYMLPAGTEWYVGPLKVANYEDVAEGSDIVVAGLSTLASASYLEPNYYTMTTYRNDDKVKDADLNITGATVYYGDEHTGDGDGSISLRYMTYDPDELLEEVGNNDYLYFYAKTVAGENTLNNATLSFGNQTVALTDEYREIRVFKEDLAKMFYTDQYATRMKFTLSAKNASGTVDYDGLRVAITSIKLHKDTSTSTYDILVYADEYGLANQVRAVSPTCESYETPYVLNGTLDTTVTHNGEPSSIKFSVDNFATGGKMGIQFDGATVANMVANYDYIIIPVYNLDTSLDENKQPKDSMYFDLSGKWVNHTGAKSGGQWTEYWISTENWSSYASGTTDLVGTTLYAWAYYDGTAGFYLGNIRGYAEGREYHTAQLTTAKNEDGTYKYFDTRNGTLSDGSDSNTVIFTPDVSANYYNLIGTRGLDADVDVNKITEMKVTFTNIGDTKVTVWTWFGVDWTIHFKEVEPNATYTCVIKRSDVMTPHSDFYGSYCGLWPMDKDAETRADYDDPSKTVRNAHEYSPVLTSLNGLAFWICNPKTWNFDLPTDGDIRLEMTVEYTYYTLPASAE